MMEVLTTAEAALKAAKAAKKDADSKLTSTKKQVAAKTKHSETMCQEKQTASEAQATYQMLFTRTAVVEEPTEEVEAEVEAVVAPEELAPEAPIVAEPAVMEEVVPEVMPEAPLAPEVMPEAPTPAA